MKLRIYFLPIILSAAFTAAWYFSPYMDAYLIKKSIVDSDIETFTEHVDFEKVKTNLRLAIGKSVGVDLSAPATDADANSPIGTLGKNVVVTLIEKMIQPPTVIHFMQASLKADAEKDKRNEAEGKPAINRYWSTKRNGPNEISFTFFEEGKDYSTSITMQRYGLATWKITNFDIPLEKIAGK